MRYPALPEARKRLSSGKKRRRGPQAYGEFPPASALSVLASPPVPDVPPHVCLQPLDGGGINVNPMKMTKEKKKKKKTASKKRKASSPAGTLPSWSKVGRGLPASFCCLLSRALPHGWMWLWPYNDRPPQVLLLLLLLLPSLLLPRHTSMFKTTVSTRTPPSATASLPCSPNIIAASSFHGSAMQFLRCPASST